MTDKFAFMVDCETLGTDPGCPVVGVAAVVFDPSSPFDPEAVADEDKFESYCSLESAMAAGLTPSPGSILFWMEQPDAARKRVFGAAGETRKDLKNMLSELAFFMSRRAPAYGISLADAPIWSHGKDFDPKVLQAAYDAVGQRVPWNFRHSMDTRTAFRLAGVEYKGKAHTPLEDCLAQCAAVCEAISRLGLGAGLAGLRVDVDALAQHIRTVDGENSLGAGRLAEEIVAFLEAPGTGDGGIAAADRGRKRSAVAFGAEVEDGFAFGGSRWP